MMSLVNSIRLGSLALVIGNLLLACARSDAPKDDPSVSPEASIAPDETQRSDATPTEVEAGVDAGSCSTSNLCVATVPIDGNVNLTSVWGSSATDVWAVGSSGTVLHYNGAVWEKSDPVDDGSTSFTLRSVWLERPDEVWIVGGPSIRRGTGWNGPSTTEWSSYTDPMAQRLPTAIRGKNGAIWLARGLTLGGGHPLVKFDGWVDGGPYAPQNIGSINVPLTTFAISRPDEVWAVSSANGRVLRASLPPQDGGAPDAAPPTWQVEEHDSRTRGLLFGVWGDELATWLVGESGTLRRMTRDAVPSKRFSSVPSPVIADLHGVFGFGADDVWVVGAQSTVLHWDGTSWTKLSTPFDHASDKPRLLAVWGSSPTDVWIAGEGTMLHFAEKP
jgi:photosystem II stability/assembly factor-like uncharacterized protein